MAKQKSGSDFILSALPELESRLGSGVFIYNFKTNISQGSEGLFLIFGIKPTLQNIEFEYFLKFVIEDERKQIASRLRSLLKSDTNFDLEFSIEDGTGKLKRILTNNFIKKNGSGDLIEHKILIKDISENYNYKLELEQKINQLNTTNLNLQEFVYIASHDLREPLRKISTFGEYLLANFGNALKEDGLTYLNRILKSSHNLEKLLDELLNFSRLSTEQLKFEKISLETCLKSVISDLETSLLENKVLLNSAVLPNIVAHSTQIKQLFNNLLSNAIKFRSENPKITISCKEMKANKSRSSSLSLKTDFYKIEIKDNGIGFEQEYAEKIFLMFQRLNGKAEYSGSGIGLAICKKIVDIHHGLIYAHSEPNKGSIFTILLPKDQK